MHTHYDNLKVSRDAPPEVIKAAYKVLSQKHHPDRNNGSPDAVRRMTIINAAYEALMDPERRTQHDAWISAQESAAAAAAAQQARREHARQVHAAIHQARQEHARQMQAAATAASRGPMEWRQPGSRTTAREEKASRRPVVTNLGTKVLVAMLVSAVGIYAVISHLGDASGNSPSMPASTTDTPPATAPVAPEIRANRGHLSQSASPAPAAFETAPPTEPRPRYIRRATAPNGEPWPLWSDYVPGYPILLTNGMSALAIDNSRNNADVFLKVVSLSSGDRLPVRFAFIRAGTSFEFSNLSPGRFDVRYMDLGSGKITKSEPFELREIAEYGGTRYSPMTLTLYKGRSGNRHTEEIKEADF